MKKRKLLLFAIVILTVSLLYLSFRPIPLHQTLPTEVESDNIEDVIEQVQEQDEEVASTTNFKEAVEQALNLFTNTDYQIAAIGDSLTQGVGDETNNDGYVGILDNRLENGKFKVEFDNFGRRGNRSDQLLTRLQDENALQRSITNADMVLITIGANDIMRIVRENFLHLNEATFANEQITYQQNLTEIFDTILTLNEEAELFLIGFYNPFEGYFDDVEELADILNDWNETGVQLAQAHPQITFIPISDLFQIEGLHLLAEDNFHPNSTGYSLIATRVHAYIKLALETIETEVLAPYENNSR